MSDCHLHCVCVSVGGGATRELIPTSIVVVSSVYMFVMCVYVRPRWFEYVCIVCLVGPTGVSQSHGPVHSTVASN